MTLPPETPSLCLCADGNHAEIADVLPLFGLPDEAVIFPAPRDAPYVNTSLDDQETLAQIDTAIIARGPWAVFVDSLTYATTKDLCEQPSIATLKTPLVGLAQRHQVNVMLFLHVSQEGQALGRRIKGITRTLIHLECPDPAVSHRLRLWVEKSYGRKPPPLGVTMHDAGNDYDFNPPARPEPRKGGRPPEKTDKAITFLTQKLSTGDEKGCDLINEWIAGGGAKGTIFNAKHAMEEDGLLVVDDSNKPQIWHLIKPGSETVNNPVSDCS